MNRYFSLSSTTTESNNNNALDSEVQNSAIPPTENLQVTNYFKCNYCKQTLEEIVFYNGHPNNSCEEFIALTNERLIIFTGEEQDLHERDSRPVHKLTGYSVYDEQGHLCPFDNDLVEQNVVLRLSGFMKPVYAEDPSIDDGIPTHDIGPINAWYITGFDGGEKAYVGILTTYAEYILMDPSPEYLAFVTLFFKKVPLLKVIIEFLLDHGWENPTYEDLLDHLQNTNSEFTEDFVLQNSHFVCKQVYSFERAAPDEEPLMGVSCMKTLINLSGVTLDRVKRNQSQKRVRPSGHSALVIIVSS
jgi:DNA (cytosine-5)-methyltransferase 1